MSHVMQFPTNYEPIEVKSPDGQCEVLTVMGHQRCSKRAWTTIEDDYRRPRLVCNLHANIHDGEGNLLTYLTFYDDDEVHRELRTWFQWTRARRSLYAALDEERGQPVGGRWDIEALTDPDDLPFD